MAAVVGFWPILVSLASLFSSPTVAIQHDRNLIWAQTPALRLTVSRLVGIEGDPGTWVPAKKPSVKHISAPHFGWEFKALSFSYRQQMLVWSEGMNKKIQALVLNGSTETVDVFTGTSSEVNGVGVDWVGRNVYWTDALYNWVLMAPLRPYDHATRVYKIILQGSLDNPHGLAVYPAKNCLVLSDWGARPRLEMTDLLGMNRRTLVDTDILEPRGLALDLQQGVLYWVDSGKGTVESLVLDGSGRGTRQVLRRDPGTKYFDLAVFNNYIFVTEQSQGLLKVFKTDPATDPVSYSLGNTPYGIVMYDEDGQPGDADVCSAFGCEHMCVLNATGDPNCLCGEGYDIKDDRKTCAAKAHFVHPSHLYAVGVAICMYPSNIADMSLDNVSLTSQCFLADRFGYLALTFDSEENMLYYSGNYTSTVSKVPLESGAKASLVASGTGTVRGLALDWVLGNLYWTDSTNAFIKVSKKNGRYQKILLATDVNNPLGIAAHPKRGKIYWTDIGFQPDVLPKIESANMDGSDREIIGKDNLGQPNHIMIYFETDKLYWTDSILCHIREYDLETKAMRVIFSLPQVKFFGLSLYKDFILWTDTDDSNGIHIARLDTKKKIRGIIHPSYGEAADLITFDKLLQPDLPSPCEFSLCSQLCLPKGSDQYTCACGLGFELQNDTYCGIGSYSEDRFILVNDAYQRNIYQLDVSRTVITAMSSGEAHEPIAIDFQTDPERLIYWSDNTAHVIRRKPLGLGREAETFLALPEDSVVDGIAVDSQNHLLFYTDTGRDVICVVTTSVYPPKHAVLIREWHEEPRDIVVSPPDGMIYWSDWGTNASIKAAKMTGEDLTILLDFENDSWPNALALDIKGRALYWADAKNNQIGMYPLDTGAHRILMKEPTAHYFGLFVMGDFLYVTDWKRRFVCRMHKLGGELMQFGEDSFTKLYGITGYNSSESLPGGKGICAGDSKCDNSSICIPQSAANHVCICIDGYEQDGRRCVNVSATTTTLTTVAMTTELPTSISTTTTTTTATSIPNSTGGGNSLPSNSSSNESASSPSPATTPPTPTLTTTLTTTLTPTLTPTTTTPTTTTTTSNTLFPISTKTVSLNTSGSPNNEDDDTDHYIRVVTTRAGSDASGTTGNGSPNRSGGETIEHGATKQATSSAENVMPSNIVIGIIVAAVLLAGALLSAAVLASFLYFRRRRQYTVPHSRLHEDGRDLSGTYSSDVKVVYARHDSADSVHFEEGFENPTYTATMAMLLKSPSGDNLPNA